MDIREDHFCLRILGSKLRGKFSTVVQIKYFFKHLKYERLSYILTTIGMINLLINFKTIFLRSCVNVRLTLYTFTNIYPV